MAELKDIAELSSSLLADIDAEMESRRFPGGREGWQTGAMEDVASALADCLDWHEATRSAFATIERADLQAVGVDDLIAIVVLKQAGGARIDAVGDALNRLRLNPHPGVGIIKAALQLGALEDEVAGLEKRWNAKFAEYNKKQRRRAK